MNRRSAYKTAVIYRTRWRQMLWYAAAFIMLCGIFFFLYGSGLFKYPRALTWVKDYIPEIHEQQSEIAYEPFGADKAYDLGVNQYDQLVFKNPAAAVTQFQQDYEDALRIIQQSAKLRSFSIQSAPSYRSYGENVLQQAEESPELLDKIRRVIVFLDLYENSIDRDNLLFVLFYRERS